MSSTTFYSTIGTANTVEHLRISYNNVASEFSTDVFRLPVSASSTGNLTLNGAFVVQTYTLSPQFATNTTNRLENRNGVLFFNDHRISTDVTVIFGYVAGGTNVATSSITTTERFTFSTGTSATQTPVLSQGRQNLGGLSDTKTYGYFGGGLSGATVAVTTSDRITFATSAIAAHTPTNLSQVTGRPASISDGVVYGYYLGGSNVASTIAKSDRLTFASSVTAVHTPANLTTARNEAAGLSDATAYGYVLGGRTSTGALVGLTSVEKITFSTSVSSTSTAVISTGRYGPAATSDDEVYGYLAGGNEGGTYYTNADRITFSSDTIAAHTPGNLSAARTQLSGTSDAVTYGYFQGGQNAVGRQTTGDRITFSSGVTAANTPANLAVARSNHVGITDATV